jgi:hypothetical protein
MLNIISLLIGLVALLLAIPASLPLLGIANWVILPIALVGLAVGVVSSSNAGRNLNIAVLIFCTIRLMLGGGVI